METTTKINIATIVKCPECLRKLCKIREYTDGPLVELKHKGAFMLAVEAIVGCVDCKKTYRINAANNLIEEIEIGRG